MSDSETTDNNARTGLTESPSDEPSRSPDGQKVIAELRARAMDRKDAVVKEPCEQGELAFRIPMAHGVVTTCNLFIEWLDDLSGCDTESQREAGTPNT